MGGEYGEGTYQLSPTQQGMLFHSLYAQQSGVDIEQIVCALPEALNVSAFMQAWRRVVERHSALRTSFRWEGLNEPLQDVHRHIDLSFEQQDWRDVPPHEQQRRLEAYLRADRKRGFDLATAPLMRLALFQLEAADYQCIWTFHHILADGRSHLLILHEAFALYEAFCQGEDLQQAQPPPYGNYVKWLQQQHFSKGETFWRQMLKGFRAPTPLHGAQVAGRLPDQEEDRGEQEIRLSVAATAALRVLAHQHQLTLNTFVQGAWALLLSRTRGEEDVIFGAVRACRRSTIEGAESMVGMFINTLPVRVQVSAEKSLLPWLQELRMQNVAVRAYEHTPLITVQEWSEVPRGMPLFESILVFDHSLLNSALQGQGDRWKKRAFRLHEKTNYPLTVYGYGEPALLLKIAYDRHRFDDASITRMLGHMQTLLEGIAAHPEQRLAEVSLLTAAERRQVLVEWNDTQTEYLNDTCIHHLFEAQVERTPDAVAVVFEDQQLTYRELNCQANQLARSLQKLGIGPEALVGICVERSLAMMVGLLGILKAGGAYVPLDPAYPKERLAFMLEDSQAPVLLTQQHLVDGLPAHRAHVVCLDTGWEALARESTETSTSRVAADNVAYVMYTSGSTGRPKGVMVQHRNVVNFFRGMDACVEHTSPGVWLAVTSISFDISVLELFWTLTRGFQVILHAKNDLALTAAEPRRQGADKAMAFSLFYFASNEEERTAEKYRLLLEGAKFADQHGFLAVWTPERHFHAFGGLYPNPSVTSAALATVTERIQIRAGSVVLPLQHPIRVAEEWAVVDNLSKGRVGISFASGWHANDFVLAPEQYATRRASMFQGLETVRKLWRGEAVSFQGGAGNAVEVKIFPQPIQRELPIWITAASSPETFRQAGEIGAYLLTHLLGQSLEQLAEKIAIYQQAWRDHGHGPGDGHVTLMLHTFVGEDIETVRETVREPFLHYLKSSSDLVHQLMKSLELDAASAGLTEADMKPHWDRAFDRYFETSGLFGTPSDCLQMIDRLKAIGVDEVACLIDFGVECESVLASLPYLDFVKTQSNTKGKTRHEPSSLPAQMMRHGVTHLQCTPSMARMLLMDPEAASSLRSLRQLLLGGEALPVSLVEQLREATSAEIHNMYGPTETTIWSTTYPVKQEGDTVPIGRPIANTATYILDQHAQPVPIGEPGELCIGGAGVVRGYWHRPELTREKFIPNPFSEAPEARLYRTGDLARYRPDGNIEFLGRLDHQVKLRGYRIELGEIETVLEQHPSVREAVTVVREDVPSDKRLVAYLTVNQPATPSFTELRNFLKEKLPEYMIPSAFMMLDTFPLTPNGKINRGALPIPDQARPELEKTFVASRTPLEEVLTRIWATLLGVERVGIYDNFFELGGHSLSAIRFIAQLHNIFQVRVPLRSLFEAPTVAELSQAMIAYETKPGQTEKIARIIKRVESMSGEEVRKSLQEKQGPSLHPLQTEPR